MSWKRCPSAEETAARPCRHFLAGDDVRCAAADEDMLGAMRAREAVLQAEVDAARVAGEELAASAAALRAEPSPLAVGQVRSVALALHSDGSCCWCVHERVSK